MPEFGPEPSLPPYFVYTYSKGSGETACNGDARKPVFAETS